MFYPFWGQGCFPIDSSRNFLAAAYFFHEFHSIERFVKFRDVSPWNILNILDALPVWINATENVVFKTSFTMS